MGTKGHECVKEEEAHMSTLVYKKHLCACVYVRACVCVCVLLVRVKELFEKQKVKRGAIFR